MEKLLWGKSCPWKSLKEHMLETGICAEVYLSARSSGAILRTLAEAWGCTCNQAIHRCSYLCALHDIGKAHPSFQRQDATAFEHWKKAGLESLFFGITSEGFRHEYCSAEIMEEIWEDLGYDSEITLNFGRILSLHHQRVNAAGLRRVRIKPEWKYMQRAIEGEMRGRFLPDDDLKKPEHMDAVCMLLSSILILCDWVASSDAFSEIGMRYMCDKDVKRMAENILREYGLISDELFPEIVDFADMFPEIPVPRPLQKLCATADKQARLTIIEAPMGEGKTEAALYMAGCLCNAYGKRGIYMALPTQATSNQMVNRVTSMLQGINIGSARLMHGMAWLTETENSIMDVGISEDAAQWLKPLRLGMLGRNAVGTVDQAMAAVLRTKFSLLRLLGMENKVLVIDEIHAYDMYMGKIIETLLRWCSALNIPVILISATLQDTQYQRYIQCFGLNVKDVSGRKYPLITQIGSDDMLIELASEAAMKSEYGFYPLPLLNDSDRIAQRALKAVENGGCLCVMLNTVAQAQAVYRAIRRHKATDVQIMLFHAQFPVERRNQIEQQCLRWFGRGDECARPSKAIIVSTQTVEQSLDICMDGMITEIAPIDLLLQRAGRVHRHRERKRPAGFEKPRIEVLVPPDDAPADPDRRYGNIAYVYDPFLLKNTEDLIATQMTIHVPENVREVIRKCYCDVTEENISAYLKRQWTQTDMKTKAMNAVIQDPEEDSFTFAEAETRFELPDTDDGLDTHRLPGTRLGDQGIRMAFLNDDLFDKAVSGEIGRDTAKKVFLKSVLLRLPGLETGAEQLSSVPVFRVDKGILRGCWLIRSETGCRIGPYTLICDNELGICREVERK